MALAALADAEPTPDEARHLAACAACAAELAAHRALLGQARATRDRVAPPLTDWSALAGALRTEGLLRPAGASTRDDLAVDRHGVDVRPLHAVRRPAAGRDWRWLARAAAVLLFTTGGVVAGRLSAGAAPVPGLALGAPEPAADRVRAILADSAPTPRTQEEAIAVLTRSERDYRRATEFLADLTSPLVADQPEVYQRRLAVMDEVASLTRAALYEAPHDPVLNQYYLASLSAREATLRQLGSVLPAGAQINRF
ncbi:MAG TPA: hypothetical protein VFS08_20580 [Gemmatimonadaceae bacterium]|nr:hypothetical protein [Gemmatimonadaceae bacterium]